MLQVERDSDTSGMLLSGSTGTDANGVLVMLISICACMLVVNCSNCSAMRYLSCMRECNADSLSDSVERFCYGAVDVFDTLLLKSINVFPVNDQEFPS